MTTASRLQAADVAAAVRRAEARIRPHVRTTYVEASPYFSVATGARVVFKLEQLQHTGSFKVRGALNKLLRLPAAQRARGVVTASTGNHGAGVAFACNAVGATGLVFVPDDADPAKVDAVRRLGPEVRTHGLDCVETEVFARRYAAAHGLVYVSPYNDLDVVAGQGTVGLELDRQLDAFDAVFVALGGGGLLGGVAGMLKAVRPGVRVVGCSPEHSPVMIESVRSGRILDLPSQPTLSDATAGGVEPDAVTFPLCRDFADDFVTVSEDAIADALRTFVATHHQLIEGSAAAALAAFLKVQADYAGRTVVVVLCGANISPATLKRIL